MCGRYCITFIEYMLTGKSLLDDFNYYLRMTIKRMTKQYISNLNTNMRNPDFRIKN